MRMTSFTDYSLRVLIYLGAQPDRRGTIAQIATAFDVSENHLTKVVHFLGKEGMLSTVRGKGGGMQLGRPASEIRLGDVVRRTEGSDLAAECFDPVASRCAIGPVCRLHGVLREAVAAFYAVLDRYTLQDLVHNRDELVQILFMPPPAATAPVPTAARKGPMP